MCLSSTSTSTKEITPPKTISTASPKSKSSPGSTARSPTRPDHLSPGQVQFPSKIWGMLEKDTNNANMTNNITILSPLRTLFAWSGSFPCEDPRLLGKTWTSQAWPTKPQSSPSLKDHMVGVQFLTKVWGLLEKDTNNTNMTNNINIFSPLRSLFACSGLFPCEDPRVFWKDLNITGMTDKTTILFVTITKRSPGRGWFHHHHHHHRHHDHHHQLKEHLVGVGSSRRSEARWRETSTTSSRSGRGVAVTWWSRLKWSSSRSLVWSSSWSLKYNHDNDHSYDHHHDEDIKGYPVLSPHVWPQCKWPPCSWTFWKVIIFKK